MPGATSPTPAFSPPHPAQQGLAYLVLRRVQVDHEELVLPASSRSSFLPAVDHPGWVDSAVGGLKLMDEFPCLRGCIHLSRVAPHQEHQLWRVVSSVVRSVVRRVQRMEYSEPGQKAPRTFYHLSSRTTKDTPSKLASCPRRCRRINDT